MRILYLIIWLFVVNALQGVLGVYFMSTNISLDLTLIAVVIYSTRFREEGGTIIGFFFGLFQDGFSGGVFGLNAFCKTLVGYIIGKTSNRLILESFITHFLIVFCASILEGVIAFLLVIIFEVVPIQDLSGNLLPSAFINGIMGILIFRLVRIFQWKPFDEDSIIRNQS